jgi:hypothetical protein
MDSASRIALAAALVLGGASAAVQPAAAQGSQPLVQPAPQPPRQYRLTKEERAALAPLQEAVNARNWAAAAAALPAAQSGASGADARYAVARLQFQMALDTQNQGMQSQAIDALIASGGVGQAELPALLQNQAVLAAYGGNNQRAEAAYGRLLDVDPNNAEALKDLAKIKNDLRKPGEAAALIDRAIAVREAAGQRPPESWYKFGLRLAVDGKLATPGHRLSRGLVAAYPSPENWRDAALAYLDLGRPGDPNSLDAWRLMRAAKALSGERDFLQYAQAASSAGLAAEAKAVLDEGVARRMVDPAKATFKELIAASGRRAGAERAGLGGRQTAAMAAITGTAALDAGDAFYGYGDYAKAAALYRAAAQKGGVDPALANIRFAAASALAGQRAEAEAALRAVTGPGSDLAGLWLIWLRQAA